MPRKAMSPDGVSVVGVVQFRQYKYNSYRYRGV